MQQTLAVTKCCFAQTFQVVGAIGAAPIRYGTDVTVSIHVNFVNQYDNKMILLSTGTFTEWN
jgi:hypothetical protein